MARELRRITKEVGQELGQAFSKSKEFLRKRVRQPPRASGQPPLAFTVTPQFIRETPRTAGKGRVLFDQFGRPVSVRNAPSVRRLKKRRR